MSANDDEPSPPREASSHVNEPPTDLLALLEREGLWRRPRVARDALFPIGCLLLFILTPLMMATCMSGSPVWLAIPAGGLILFFAAARFTTSRQQKEAAQRLARYNDLRIVGRLVEALNWPEWDVEKAASAALVQLLPRLKASDAPLLNENQRSILYRWLRKSNSNLPLPILKALEQIGDEAAIPHVERLAKRRARTPRQQEIRAAARECLITLRSRADQTGQRLLRPTGSPDDPAETLLRPAGNSPPSDPERLLRPADPAAERPEPPAEPPRAPEKKEE